MMLNWAPKTGLDPTFPYFEAVFAVSEICHKGWDKANFTMIKYCPALFPMTWNVYNYSLVQGHFALFWSGTYMYFAGSTNKHHHACDHQWKIEIRQMQIFYFPVLLTIFGESGKERGFPRFHPSMKFLLLKMTRDHTCDSLWTSGCCVGLLDSLLACVAAANSSPRLFVLVNYSALSST